MSSNEPFGPWIDAMERVGAVDPRSGRPSWNQLATRAGIHTTSLTRLATGRAKARPETVQAVARALRVKPQEVSSWIAEGPAVGDPYQPIADAALLTAEERTALDELIRTFTRGRLRGGGEHDQRSAPMNSGADADGTDQEQGARVLPLGGRRRGAEQERDTGTTVPPQERAAANEDQTLEEEGIAQLEDP